MRIAIVSPYPPSKGTLNEYAFHLVSHFRNKKEINEILILTDRISYAHYPPEEKIIDKVRIIPCWQFNSWNNSLEIRKTLEKYAPDVVLYNIQFLSFGDKKIPATLGLFTPLLTKRKGIPSMVLLHNITETVDYASAGITKSKLLQKVYDQVGTLLTKIILAADMVAVTIPEYVDILTKKYHKHNIALLPHGTFEVHPWGGLQYNSPEKSLMTFGKFGTYKKVEKVIDAVVKVRERTGEMIKVIIAGTDNPNVPGYLDRVKKKYASVEGLEFTGYVAEENVPSVFRECTATIFPYTSTTGSSGVLHQAGSYGKAAILPHIGDLKILIEEEGYAGEFFEPDDVKSMSDAIEKVLFDDVYRKELERKNYAAASCLPMSELADWYILHFKHLAGIDLKPSKRENIEKNQRQEEIVIG